MGQEITIEKEMGLSHRDFFRTIANALGTDDFESWDTGVRKTSGDKVLEIKLGPEGERRIAMMVMPRTMVTLSFTNYDPDFSRFSPHVPPLIYSRSLTTQIELEQFRDLTDKSIPVYAHVSLYENIEDNLSSIFLRGVDIEEVIAKNSVMKAQLEKIIQDKIADYNYIALKAKYQNMILIMEENGNLVGEVKAPYILE